MARNTLLHLTAIGLLTLALAACAGQSRNPSRIAASSGSSVSLITEIFARNDLNEDGVITQEELRESRQETFETADSNGDGRVTRSEFPTLQAGISQPPRRQIGADPFRALDTNDDRGISESEFFAAEDPVLSRADRNGDGSVTRSELRSFIARTTRFGE